MSASKTLKKNLSIAVAAVFLAVATFACWAIEPSKAYADTTSSHLTVASEVHVLVDSEGNVTIPNATVTNDGTCAAYIMGCSSPDGLGWTCDAVGKRIEVGQSITATWRSTGPVSDEIAAQLGEEPYYAGNLTYTYTDGDLKGTVSLDNTDPTVGDTITATVTGANVPDDKLIYQWVKVKDGSETSIDGATGSTYTATDDDAGYELVCKVSSTDDICQGTISGATGAVKKILAFAVYSADDGSLNFYKRAGVPAAGEQFNGKTATATYTGIEDTNGSQPWSEYMSDIKTATVVDSGIQPKNTAFWFTRCVNMTQFDASKLDVSQTTNMMLMFYGCSSLTFLALSGWDTSKVSNMDNMCDFCNNLQLVMLGDKWQWVGTKGYLPTPDPQYITGADGKWYDTDGNAYAPADIPSNKAMTYYASKDLLPQAFAVYSDDDQSLNFYKRAGVPAAGEQFNGKTATATYTGIEDTNGSVSWSPWSKYESSIKTATVVDDGIQPKSTACWFYACAHMTQCDISKLDTSKVTNMNRMFRGCYSLTALDVSSFDTSKVTNMIDMFRGCSKLTALDVLSFDTSNVVNMNCMFNSCSSLTSLDLSSFDTNNVTYMNNMFSYCPNLTTVGDLSGWNVSNLTDATSMFSGCSSLTSLDLSSFDTSNVTYMRNMFQNCPNLTTVGDLSSWDTSNVTDTSYMFTDCSKLTTLDLSSWNTSNVTDMSYMFSGCTNLTSIGNLSSWNTSNVTNMRDMFSYCSSLTSLGDLSSWNTSKVTNMRSTFYGCFKLSADCSNWDVSKVTDHRYFNADASGVILPSAWQTSSDEGVKDSTIATLCEEQGNGDALSVSDENGNDEAASKTDGKASADSETEGSNTASATDEAGAKEETSGDIVQEETAAA